MKRILTIGHPEAGVDPDGFFDALAPLCGPPRPSGRELRLVTRSWERTSLLDELVAALSG